MSQNEQTGLLFAGTLYASLKDPKTGIFGPYTRLECDKFELKVTSDKLQKVSKSRERFGQAWLTHHTPKPTEFSLTLDEVNRDVFAMQLSGTITDIDQAASAVAGLEVTVKPGGWVPLGVEVIDEAAIVVKSLDDATTYDKDTDYTINPRLGLIYVPFTGSAIIGPKVKVTTSKLSYSGIEIAGASQHSHTMAMKLDGKNLINGKDIILDAPQGTVSSQDAFDFLSGKLASVPLSGNLEVPPGANAPFTLREF
jgi:hypothetical protein